MLKIVVGNKNYSSWSLRAWLLVKKLREPFEEVVIGLDRPDTADAIKKYSPAGRVPVLVSGNLTVWDSLAIGEYLAETYPACHLWPKDAGARALARSISAEMHSGFQALRTQCPMNMRERIQQDTPREALDDAARVRAIWTSTRERFGAGEGFAVDGRRPQAGAPGTGPFLFGGFTVADAMYAPVVSRFRTYGLPLTGAAAAYAEAVWNDPDFQSWYEAARTETLRIPKYETPKAT
ncbi:MAG: glutathione S-transferase family protein [Myxococcales bacterium]